MTEAEVKALFTMAQIPVERVWQLPNAYLGPLEPLTDHEVSRDTSQGLSRPVYHVITSFDKESPEPTQNVVRHWMQDYTWRFNSPAWLVKTPYGLIEIGWRKRVINIDWSDTGIKTIVTDEDVTKSLTMVHAWSLAKAMDYLTMFALAAKGRER